MRSMTASPLLIATFCLHLLDINAQENPPILKTPKPAPGKQTPKTPTPLRTGGGNQYFIEKHTRIIDQVTGWEIVTPINDDRIIIENFLDGFGRQPGLMSLNADMGVLP